MRCAQIQSSTDLERSVLGEFFELAFPEFEILHWFMKLPATVNPILSLSPDLAGIGFWILSPRHTIDVVSDAEGLFHPREMDPMSTAGDERRFEPKEISASPCRQLVC